MTQEKVKNKKSLSAWIGKGFRKISDFFYSVRVKLHAKCGGKKIKQHAFRGQRKKDLWFCIGVLAIPLACFLVFYVAVNLNSVLLAFKSYEIINTANGVEAVYTWVRFENFTRFFRNTFTAGGGNGVILKNSLVLYAFQFAAGLPLALLFSFYIYKKRAFSAVFQVILFFPSIVSSIVMTILFQYFVQLAIPEFVLSMWNIPDYSLFGRDVGGRWAMIVFYNVWSGFGLGIIMYSNAMSRIPVSITESAQLDGISSVREFWHITLPLIYPTVSTFIVTGVAGIFTNQANIQGFYGVTESAIPGVQTIGYSIFQSIMRDSTNYSNYPSAAATGVALTVIVAPLVILIRWLLEKFGPEAEF